MTKEKVQELAETLKKQGLAASMYEAMEKAKRIMDAEGKEEAQKESPVKEQQTGQQEQPQEKEEIKEKFDQPNYDVSREKVTVNELMSELGVNPEQVKETEKEKIGEEVQALKKEIKEADKEDEEVKKEKTEQLKEKIEELKEETEELEEEQ